MGNVLHYWMVEPPRGGIFDDGKKQPAFEVQMKSHDGRQTDAAVFCDDSGDPEFIRVRDHGATIQTVNANADLVMVAREHVVSVLRFTWFGGGRLLPTSFYTEEPDVGSGASIRVEWPSSFAFDGNAAKDFFVHTFEKRQSVRLLADGINDDIPLQYRYLSLYKFLEIRFRGDDDRWDHGAITRALGAHRDAFGALRLDRTFEQELNHLRDRCAHIRSGSGKRRRLGVTSLNYEARVEVERLMPILLGVCRDATSSWPASTVRAALRRWWGRSTWCRRWAMR
jgi:hypothetical protein